MSADQPRPDPPARGQLLVYPAGDGRVKIEVRLENETVWLTQQHMAELFQTTEQNISLHLQNIYEEGELQRAATHKEYLSVRQEGMRRVPMHMSDWITKLHAFLTINDRHIFRQEAPVSAETRSLSA